jgi:hypothetical protein
MNLENVTLKMTLKKINLENVNLENVNLENISLENVNLAQTVQLSFGSSPSLSLFTFHFQLSPGGSHAVPSR